MFSTSAIGMGWLELETKRKPGITRLFANSGSLGKENLANPNYCNQARG